MEIIKLISLVGVWVWYKLFEYDSMIELELELLRIFYIIVIFKVK